MGRGENLTLEMNVEKRNAIAEAYLTHILRASRETIDNFAAEPPRLSEDVKRLNGQMSGIAYIERPVPDKKAFWDNVHEVLGKQYDKRTMWYRMYFDNAGENNFLLDIHTENKDDYKDHELLRKIIKC
jgi:hypothetical protein